jgi:hypothetical protein
MTKVRSAEELGEAIKNGESTIEIEGDLAKKTIRLRATGTVAWAIAFGAIAIAAGAAFLAIPTGGASSIAVAGIAPVATGILGVSVTTTAIGITIAAGGVGALTKLRQYEEVRRSDGLLILRKK